MSHAVEVVDEQDVLDAAAWTKAAPIAAARTPVESWISVKRNSPAEDRENERTLRSTTSTRARSSARSPIEFPVNAELRGGGEELMLRVVRSVRSCFPAVP